MTPSPPADGYDRITPYHVYQDAGAMMAWLTETFGMAERHVVRRPDGHHWYFATPEASGV